MPSAERIALVERLVRENKSNKEIAEILGIKQTPSDRPSESAE